MQWQSILALLVVLVLGLSFAVPEEDASETSYDESESLPFDRIPVVSIGAAKISRSAPAVRPRGSKLMSICCEKPEITRLDIRAGLPHSTCHSLTVHQSFRC